MRQNGQQHDRRYDDEHGRHQRREEGRPVGPDLWREFGLQRVEQDREHGCPRQRNEEGPEHEVGDVHGDEHEHIERRTPQTIVVVIGHRVRLQRPFTLRRFSGRHSGIGGNKA